MRGHVHEQALELRPLKRLGHVVADPELAQPPFQLTAALARQRHDAGVRMLILDRRDQLQRGHVREENVQQVEVECLQLDLIERLGGIRRFRDPVPPRFHHLDEQLPLQRLVIHNEHVQGSPLLAEHRPCASRFRWGYGPDFA